MIAGVGLLNGMQPWWDECAAFGIELLPAPPVPAGQGSWEWLVRSSGYHPECREAASLTFKGGPDQQARLTLAAQPLRQWLGILHDAYCKAEWPLQVWPQWVPVSTLPVERPAVVWH